MKKKLSLQWRLTLITAIMVIVACLTLSFVISRSAVLYMDNIEDSAISIFPDGLFSDETMPKKDSQVTLKFYPDTAEGLSNMVKDIQAEFWSNSLLIASFITLMCSAMIYFVVGYVLRPLDKLSRQIQDIQAKNMQQPIALKDNSIEILRITDAFNGMLRRLGDAFFAQRQFSANAAHELRTPLAVMQTEVEVLEKNKYPGNNDYKEIIDKVKTQTARLSHVIDVLLEMTELQSAKKATISRLQS